MDYQLTTTDSIPLRHNLFTIVTLVIAYITVLILGLVGNVLVIFVVLRMSKMKTATKYFILNLAIADLLVLIFCLLPGLIANIYVPWVMGSSLCKAVPYIQGVSVCASVYSLAAISADRLMAIGAPLRRQVTKSVARRIIVLIWIWGAGLALPWLLYFDLGNTDRNNPSLFFCTENWPSQMYGSIYFVVVNLGLFYLFPLSFICFCHLSIWRRIRNRPVPTSPSVPQIKLVRKRAKASVQKLVIVVVVGFAACWLPLYVIFVRIKIIPSQLGTMEEEILDYALPIAQWLGAANSCMNPVLYTFFNRSFRYTLRRLVGEFCAFKTPKNYPNCPHHHHHQHSNQGSNVVGLSVTFQRSPLKHSQLKNSGHNGLDFGESNLVTLYANNKKFTAITRSQTYMEAMENPWRCPTMKPARVE